MRVGRFFSAVLVMGMLGACTHYRPMKEIKHIGYSQNVSKGDSKGRIEGDDCVYQVLGYWLGGQPSFDKAMSNARTGSKSSIGDAFASSGEGVKEGGVRYLTDVRYENTGFNAVIFGKRCIQVAGRGYL